MIVPCQSVVSKNNMQQKILLTPGIFTKYEIEYIQRWNNLFDNYYSVVFACL